MVEEGICSSPLSLKLTTVVWWYLGLCWLGKVLKCIFVLLKPRVNNSSCVYGQTAILKNCIIFRKHLDHRMYLVTWNVHVVTGSNSTIQSNYKTRRVPGYCCPNRHRSISMFHSWNQACSSIGFLGCSPNINLTWCWEQGEGRLIWSHYVYSVIRCPGFMIITLCFSIFSVNRGLAVASLLWLLDLWSSYQTVCVEAVSSRWLPSFVSPLLQCCDF